MIGHVLQGHRPPRPPVADAPHLSDEIWTLIEAAWHSDPHQRLGSLHAIAELSSRSPSGVVRRSSPEGDAPGSYRRSSAHDLSSSPDPTKRPRPIAELAELANVDYEWNISSPLKDWLRIAEKYQKRAAHSHNERDIETAFIYYGKAAYLLLKKIPQHPQYTRSLGVNQRHDLRKVHRPFFLCVVPHLRWEACSPSRSGVTDAVCTQLNADRMMFAEWRKPSRADGRYPTHFGCTICELEYAKPAQ